MHQDSVARPQTDRDVSPETVPVDQGELSERAAAAANPGMAAAMPSPEASTAEGEVVGCGVAVALGMAPTAMEVVLDGYDESCCFQFSPRCQRSI